MGNDNDNLPAELLLRVLLGWPITEISVLTTASWVDKSRILSVENFSFLFLAKLLWDGINNEVRPIITNQQINRILSI